MDTAFFALSKIVGWLIEPLHIVVEVCGASLVAQRLGRLRAARVLALVMVVIVAGLSYVPIPYLWVRYIENRIPRSPVDYSKMAGILVLGGAFERGSLTEGRAQVALNSAAERMTTTVELARRHPHLTILFSGSTGKLISKEMSEAQIARMFFDDQGIDQGRIVYEGRSRNTAENALFSKALIVDMTRPWILITSASHMPRSVAVFRRQGIRIVPYPVDFQTSDTIPWGMIDLAYGAALADIAIHESVGWAIYRFTGRL